MTDFEGSADSPTSWVANPHQVEFEAQSKAFIDRPATSRITAKRSLSSHLSLLWPKMKRLRSCKLEIYEG